MTRTIITLADCPFCREEAGVLFDRRATTQANLAKFERNGSDAGVESGIFVYNSDRAEPGPCEHTVYLHLDIETWWHGVDEYSPGSQSYFNKWHSPPIEELDPDGASRQLLSLLVKYATPKGAYAHHVLIEENKRFLANYRPKTRFVEYQFSEFLENLTGESVPEHVIVSGDVTYAADITKLFKELQSALRELTTHPDFIASRLA